MKSFKMFAVATIITMFATACNDETDLVINNSKFNEKDIEVINGTLKFKNTEVYNDILGRMHKSSDSKIVSFLDSIGIKTQFVIMYDADRELSKITSSYSDDASFHKEYAEYKEKYKDIFMFNDIDKTDLSPYSCLAQLENLYFFNSDGKFMIGDSLVISKKFVNFADYYKDVTNMEIQEENGILLRSEVSSLSSEKNHAWSHQKNRKVGIYLSRGYVPDVIYARLTAQARVKCGLFSYWERISTVFFCDLYCNSGQFQIIYANKTANTYYTFGPTFRFRVVTPETYGNTTIPLCIKAGRFTGTIEIWSRGVSYEDRGFSSIDL